VVEQGGAENEPGAKKCRRGDTQHAGPQIPAAGRDGSLPTQNQSDKRSSPRRKLFAKVPGGYEAGEGRGSGFAGRVWQGHCMAVAKAR
jgi:hypothetical protein